MKFIVKEKDFYIWVRDMNNSWKNRNKEKYKNLVMLHPNERTFVIVNIKTGKTAISRCNPNDTPNDDIGIAVVWSKYLNRIPCEIGYKVSMFDLRKGDRFVWGITSYTFDRFEVIGGVQYIICFGTETKKEHKIDLTYCNETRVTKIK